VTRVQLTVAHAADHAMMRGVIRRRAPGRRWGRHFTVGDCGDAGGELDGERGFVESDPDADANIVSWRDGGEPHGDAGPGGGQTGTATIHADGERRVIDEQRSFL